MSGKHTKGPWTISGASAAPFINVEQAGTRCDVCAVSCDDPGPEEQAANARLIAAAPELLDGLREALTWMETYKRFNAVGDEGPLAQDIAKVRGIIAKATEATP